MDLRYLVCSEYKRLVCKARACMPVGGTSDDLQVTIPHNHPPCPEAHEKAEFVKFVKRSILLGASKDGRLMDIYKSAVQIHPQAKHFYTYVKLAPSMRRWRILARKGLLKIN